jgi:hypothetical protein
MHVTNIYVIVNILNYAAKRAICIRIRRFCADARILAIVYILSAMPAVKEFPSVNRSLSSFISRSLNETSSVVVVVVDARVITYYVYARMYAS